MKSAIIQLLEKNIAEYLPDDGGRQDFLTGYKITNYSPGWCASVGWGASPCTKRLWFQFLVREHMGGNQLMSLPLSLSLSLFLPLSPKPINTFKNFKSPTITEKIDKLGYIKI